MAKVEKEITLPVLLNGWVKDDTVLNSHFYVRADATNPLSTPGAIYFDCWKRLGPSRVTAVYNRNQRELVAEIHVDRIVIVFANQEFYKFQAVHPMFFQKLRGHLFDMHNRSPYACKEHLR